MNQMGEQKATLKHTMKLGNIQFLSYLKSQPQTVHTIFSIEKYLEGHPAFYLNSILTLLKGKQIKHVQQYISKEYQCLVKGSSFLQKMNTSIEARRKCINKIRRDLTKASRVLNLFKKEYLLDTADDAAYVEWVELQGYSAVDVDDSIQNSIKLLNSIFNDMCRLREMTIYIVESIHSWRMEVQEHADRCHQHQPVYFLHEGADIYQTILSDTHFIWVSRLSAYIWMQAKQDPFFIRNVIHIQQLQTKTPLQKYFVETLYPKHQATVDKCLKCFEMLVFKYKPKVTNLFEEEEMLIENYLRLEMQNHQFEEQPKDQQAIQAKQQKEEAKPPHKKSKLSVRGWVFQKNLRGKSRDRINQIIESHKYKSNIIRPFNIANYGERNSIALAYLSNAKQERLDNRAQILSQTQDRAKQNFFSQGEEHRQGIRREKKQIESEPQLKRTSQSRMFKSLTKLNPVIFEDPKQHIPDTPRRKQDKKSDPPALQKGSSQGLVMKQPSLNQIKLNSFDPLAQELEEERIEVDEQQTPLNMKQFFEVFRADTTQKKIDETVNPKQGVEKIKSIKQFLLESRKTRAKSLNIKKPLKKKKQDLAKEKGKDQSNNSYKEFSILKAQGVQQSNKDIENKVIKLSFINLKAKSIPFDLIAPYVKYISSQQHSTSHSFTDFKPSQVLRKLSDPFIHCIIFDVLTETHEHLGHVVLSENVSGRAGKLKYTVQFMNIHTFEYVISTVLRISQQLLSATPCQEVIFPFIVDKLDLVSSHFIELIDAGLRERVGKFGTLSILQKSRPSYKGSDVKQRLYIFTSETNLKREYELGLKMMGNYRSLKFEARCLVMCSNFRLRTKNLLKDIVHKYKDVCIGELYVHILSKIMTKYHLKQLKAASFSLDTQDELTQLLHKDLFTRNIISNLMGLLQEEKKDELVLLTAFDSMTDLINYLRYKKHDSHFQFHFLEESRFILNHELVLSQFQHELSLEFTLTSNKEVYVLHNHKHLPITMLTSKNVSSSAYLIPTSNEKIKLLLMSALEYVGETTDELDLFTYINYFFKDIHIQTNLADVPAVVLPNLKGNNSKVTPIRMYNGFLNLFPEREFFSATMVSCMNHWQSYYQNAVIHLPNSGSIVMQYPFLLGFYDVRNKNALTAFLYESP